MSFDRRSFLSMMAALPFTANINALVQGSEKKTPLKGSNFYVWTHGIFGMSWTKPENGSKPPGIRLVCPNLTTHSGGEHVYRVGRVSGKGSNLVHLKKAGSYKMEYRFKGLKPGCSTKEAPPPTALHGTLKDDYDGYSYQLPCPSRIISLRGFYSSLKCTTPNNKIPQQPQWLPMVHVFVYENVIPEGVRLVSNDAKKPVWNGSKSNHLHLFVEPSDISIEKPDYTAPLNALLSCYDNVEQITIDQLEPCLRLDDVSGFCDDLREQYYLYEWRHKSPCRIGKESCGAKETYRPQGCPQFWVVEQ